MVRDEKKDARSGRDRDNDLPDGQVRRDIGDLPDASSPSVKNISLYQKCKSVVWSAHPGPLRGTYRDRHETLGAGCDGRLRLTCAL